MHTTVVNIVFAHADDSHQQLVRHIELQPVDFIHFYHVNLGCLAINF